MNQYLPGRSQEYHGHTAPQASNGQDDTGLNDLGPHAQNEIGQIPGNADSHQSTDGESPFEVGEEFAHDIVDIILGSRLRLIRTVP